MVFGGISADSRGIPQRQMIRGTYRGMYPRALKEPHGILWVSMGSSFGYLGNITMVYTVLHVRLQAQR